MLSTAVFYKSTPKIMPKSLKMKRVPSPAASPVSKKRRVRQNGIISVEKIGGLQSNWTPQVVIMKLQSVVSDSACSSMGKPALTSTSEGNWCTDDTTTNTIKAASGKAKNGSINGESAEQPRRSSARVKSLRSSNIKKEITQEVIDEEEEEEKPALLGNLDSDDDEDSDDSGVHGKMSAYERKRLQNIQENAVFFASLGISKTKDKLTDLTSAKGNNIIRGLKRETKQYKKSKPLPRRPPSLRIRRIDPEGEPLPDIPVPPAFFEEPAHVRKPSGPLDMEPTNVGDGSEKNLPSRLFKSIASLPKSPKAADHPQDLDAFIKTLQRMTLIPERIAKVTKNRVFSLAVHPSPSKLIACAGDKWGRVGVWDVESQAGDDGVYLFEPHSRPVSCLLFAPSNPAKLYSCSYDGTARCGDFERGVFDEIHSTNEDEDIHCSHFDFLSPDGVKLLVAQSRQQGYVQVVDSRLRCHSSTPGFLLHKRYVKTVHIHPTRPELFVSACNDGTVALWDLRTLKEHGQCTSISSVIHGRSVSSAYFSPITGNKIVTTAYDDKIRILQMEDSGTLKLQSAASHNNHTGRWLSTFRATWHPRREDVIVVGSMERPRRIDLLDVRGHILHSLQDEDYLASVCSVNVWHPNRDIVVGANSSGRLQVFM